MKFPGPTRRGGVEHRKEGANGDVGVDVRGAVERIGRHEQRSVGVDRDRIAALFGDDAATPAPFRPLTKASSANTSSALCPKPSWAGPTEASSAPASLPRRMRWTIGAEALASALKTRAIVLAGVRHWAAVELRRIGPAPAGHDKLALAVGVGWRTIGGSWSGKSPAEAVDCQRDRLTAKRSRMADWPFMTL